MLLTKCWESTAPDAWLDVGLLLFDVISWIWPLWILIGFTLLYFKMAVIQLVPEKKMVDVGKLISLGNLLVRKLTWFVLTTTSAPLILSRAFGADHMTRIAYIYSRLPRSHFLTFWLTETALSLSLSLHFQLPETAWHCNSIRVT